MTATPHDSTVIYFLKTTYGQKVTLQKIPRCVDSVENSFPLQFVNSVLQSRHTLWNIARNNFLEWQPQYFISHYFVSKTKIRGRFFSKWKLITEATCVLSAGRLFVSLLMSNCVQLLHEGSSSHSIADIPNEPVWPAQEKVLFHYILFISMVDTVYFARDWPGEMSKKKKKSCQRGNRAWIVLLELVFFFNNN